MSPYNTIYFLPMIKKLYRGGLFTLDTGKGILTSETLTNLIILLRHGIRPGVGVL